MFFSFFPYAALGLGANTSISVSAILGIAAWIVGPRHPRLDAITISLALIPLAANAIATVLFSVTFPPTGVLTWIGVIGNFLTGTLGVLSLHTDFSRLLAWLVIGTSLFGGLQMIAIRAGYIPFVTLYRAPGYASVENNSTAILNYIQRPFAQFPEPSFMAGTLLLAITLMVLVARCLRGSLSRWEWTAVVAGGAIITASESGSAIAGLGLVAGVIITSATKSLRNQITALLFITAACVTATWVFGQRSSPLDFSWSDRFGSILAGLNYWSDEPSRLVFGTGRGGMAAAFRAGDVGLIEFAFVQQPLDVFSAQFRILFEFGLLAGGFVLLGLLLIVGSVSRWTRPVTAAFALALWVLIGALTISYDSAAWVWAFAGGCLGLLTLARRQSPKSVGGRERR
ncbi:hypothetical protein ACI3KS_00170 [Microbacterium sp. ZW T5_45]|uniref:hypothetical protein n=1 Tax=Microbacterium sp. ZW T5_45 TaxID=3378080 RepID=UPI0038532C17